MFKVIQVIKNSYPKKKKNSDVSPLIQEASSGPDHLVGFYCAGLPQAVLGGRWWSFAWRKECGSPPVIMLLGVNACETFLGWGPRAAFEDAASRRFTSSAVQWRSFLFNKDGCFNSSFKISFFSVFFPPSCWDSRVKKRRRLTISVFSRSQCCPWDPTPGKFHSCL